MIRVIIFLSENCKILNGKHEILHIFYLETKILTIPLPWYPNFDYFFTLVSKFWQFLDLNIQSLTIFYLYTQILTIYLP